MNHRKLQFIVCVFLLIFIYSVSSSAENTIVYSLATPQIAKIVEGVVTIEQSSAAYISPGTLTLSNLKGNKAVIRIGDPFQVEGGMSYNLSFWSKTHGMRRTQMRAIIKWYDKNQKEIDRFNTPWAITDYDWLEYGDAGAAPKSAVSGQVFLEIMISTLGPLPKDFVPGTFIINHLTVSRTPRIDIQTGRRCNLIFAGEPLKLDIMIGEIPSGMEQTQVKGVVLNYWRESVGNFSIPLSGTEIKSTKMFPNLPRGYYSIEWSLEKGGSKLRKGVISAAIVPALSSRFPDSDIPFAIDAGLSAPFDGKPEVTANEGSYMSQYAGVHTLRERPGPKDRVIYAARRQKEAGIDPYHVCYNFDDCLRNSSRADSSTGSLYLMEVYEKAKQSAQEFGDLIPYWEVWNEPDIFFFPGRAEEFAAISKATYLGVHAGNPNAQVLNGSLAHVAGQWYEDVFRNGLKNYFDIFNMHYYIQPIGVVERIRKNKEMLNRFEIEKPIWITEMGYYCYKSADGSWWQSEQGQAIHAVEANCFSIAQGVHKFFLFYLQEFLENGWAVWGITRSNWTPKPAYAALSNLTYLLGKGEYLGHFDLGLPGSYGYVFNNGTEPVLVAWAQEKTSISLPGKNLTAVDMLGKPTSPCIVSRFPIYVFGIDLNSIHFHRTNWGIPQYAPPDLKKLSVLLAIRGIKDKDYALYPAYRTDARKEPIEIGINEKLPVELKVCNFSNDIKTVNLRWQLPEGWTFVEKEIKNINTSLWSEQNLVFHVQPKNAQSGTYYNIQVDGMALDREVAPAFMRVKIK